MENWEVGPYQIKKSNCLGPAGPAYYPLSVYKMKKYLGSNGFQKDSCTITFQERDDLYLIFNICQKGLVEIKHNKKTINISEVDSVRMFSNELQQTKLLTKEAIHLFVKAWNQSEAHDYRDKNIDSVFYPTYQYKLSVYTRNGLQEFLCVHYLINDRTHWTYLVSKKEDTNYFHKLWKY